MPPSGGKATRCLYPTNAADSHSWGPVINGRGVNPPWGIRRLEDAVLVPLVHPGRGAAGAAAGVDLRLDEAPDRDAVDLQRPAIAIFKGDGMPVPTGVGHDTQAVCVACAAALNREIWIARPGERGSIYPLARSKRSCHCGAHAPRLTGPFKETDAGVHVVLGVARAADG